MTSNSTSVLAIGIDAAESTLVRQLIEHDEMPALKSLLEDGKWLSVRSPSPIGSGTVWPTFITGEEPTLHGNYSEWKWLPETMSLRRYHGLHLIPFWKKLAEQGLRVGVFDVPFAPPVGIAHDFWGKAALWLLLTVSSESKRVLRLANYTAVTCSSPICRENSAKT